MREKKFRELLKAPGFVRISYLRYYNMFKDYFAFSFVSRRFGSYKNIINKLWLSLSLFRICIRLIIIETTRFCGTVV